MTNLTCFVRLSTAALCLGLTAIAASAGDLTPPAGPIAPTMKTLDEVEPSTPINATNTPGDANSTYVITEPGAYHLTENLIGEADKFGIRVLASDVTIDLRGFVLDGQDVGEDAIYCDIPVAPQRIRVTNGSVTGWMRYGVYCQVSEQVIIDDMRVHNCGDTGIWTGERSLVRGCSVMLCGRDGIAVDVGSVVTNCVSSLNTDRGFYLPGARAHNSMAHNNIEEGFVGGSATSCFSGSNSIGFSQMTQASLCAAFGNNLGFSGLDKVESCQAQSAYAGFSGCVFVLSCRAYDCTVGFDAVKRVESCSANNCQRGYDLIIDGSIIQSHYERGGVVDGSSAIRVRDNVAVIDCTIADAGLAGIRGVAPISGVEIRGCVITNPADSGVSLDGTDHTIIDTKVVGAGSQGVYVEGESTIRGCHIENATGNGIIAENDMFIYDCVVRNPGGNGIYLGGTVEVRRCVVIDAAQNGIEAGNHATIESCKLESIGGAGMLLGQRSSVRACDVTNTTNSGISVGIVSTVQDCLLGNIGFIGISASESCIIANNSLNNCARHGISLSSRCTVRDNNIDFSGYGADVNDGAGILCTLDDNRIDGNNVTRADYGIRTLAGGNLIINNSVVQVSVQAFATNPGDSVAAILNSVSIGSSSAAHANFIY